MLTNQEIKNTLQFVNDTLRFDVLPYFEMGTHEYSPTDMTNLTLKFVDIMQELVSLDSKIQIAPKPRLYAEFIAMEPTKEVHFDIDIDDLGGSFVLYVSVPTALSASIILINGVNYKFTRDYSHINPPNGALAGNRISNSALVVDSAYQSFQKYEFFNLNNTLDVSRFARYFNYMLLDNYKCNDNIKINKLSIVSNDMNLACLPAGSIVRVMRY